MDLNKFAKEVTLKEGKKLNLSIAQVKEVMKIVFTKLAKTPLSEVVNIFKKYGTNKK